MDSQPLISVVTVSFNHGDFLKANIESVLAQNYPRFEHIVIDGGSTDNTREVLKSYEHLSWVSESDRGQTHALNKGFSKASGDIICWLNSDDQLAERAFEVIIPALRDYPVVMGACELTDREGNTTSVVQNVERNWFDILKYWIPHSVPAQPSVFFRRDLLEALRRSDGSYLDEELFYCMDYELWLRMAKRFPFIKRVPEVLSRYPMYDESKTGGDWNPIYHEMARVFRRHERQYAEVERDFTFVIPLHEVNAEVESTVRSIFAQAVLDAEVLLLDCSPEYQERKPIHDMIQKNLKNNPGVTFRYGRGDTKKALALKKAVSAANGRLLVVLEPGWTVDSNFSFEALRLFQSNNVGMTLILESDQELGNTVKKPGEGPQFFDPQAVFTIPFLPPCFVIRRMALLECFEQLPDGDISTWTREVAAWLSFNNWQIDIGAPIYLQNVAQDWMREKERGAIFLNYVNAKLIKGFYNQVDANPFVQLRTDQGYCFLVHQEASRSAEKLLQLAPPEWTQFKFIEDPSLLEAITSEFPDFAPGWFFLSQSLSDQEQASAAYQHFEAKRVEEQGY